MSIMSIQIVVAVDEAGNIECMPFVPYNLQQKQKTDAFVAEKKADKRMWQISYLNATVPVPATPVIDASVSVRPWD
ncbi:MAG: hypothetical protein Q7U66_10715 [Methylobacter sp.]|nr:hypothetical protein [Methylobacter sp.]